MDETTLKTVTPQDMGKAFVVRERRLVDFGGVPVGRLVIDGELWGAKIVALDYILPGGEASGLILFVTPAERWSKLEPIFDAAARATRGLARQRAKGSGGTNPLLQQLAIATAVGLAVAFFVLRCRDGRGLRS